MKPAVTLLSLIFILDAAFAAEESCVGQCGSFDPQRKCQCDSMCVYYGSCCADFDTVCPKKVARGDTFEAGEDVTEALASPAPTAAAALTTAASGYSLFPGTTNASAPPADPDAQPCSGRPFDAFLQLKNGSIYAFRGEYFFELDDTAVLPGYPKLIQDVWGIPGPVDAAFTRINCQGKTYIFKGNKYWRFDGDVMDEDFPRDISAGFGDKPSDIDAAFAVPAPNYRGKEKAFFFKGDQYYEYEFKHQPSHEECVHMSRSSPSLLFTHYTDLFCEPTLEDLFAELFGSSISSHPTGPRFSRDWRGLRFPVDAAMVGRVHLSPQPTAAPRPAAKRRSSLRRRLNKKRRQRGRKTRQALFDDFWGYDWLDFFGDDSEESTMQEYKMMPLQNVYFFKGDKYYRVNLQTKRVDYTDPPYPRSIAKYWLGCKDEEAPDESRAEKK